MNRLVFFVVWLIFLSGGAAPLTLVSALAASTVSFQFERMIPALHQPWYLFRNMEAFGVDDLGSIYTCSTQDYLKWDIQKFSGDGSFITSWEIKGVESQGPIRSLALDREGNIYAASYYDSAILKYSPTGKLLTKWGGPLEGDPIRFVTLNSVAVDESGFVYALDGYLCRIQKFTSDGQLITMWGSKGWGQGRFLYPACLAVDKAGSVYVVDWRLSRIQKFTSDGEFITRWGSYGEGDGQFIGADSITVDWEGNIVVAEYNNPRLQKFTPEGQFICKWDRGGWGEDPFIIVGVPIAADKAGAVYVVTQGGLDKFTSDGLFLNALTSVGLGYTELGYLNGMALDREENIYVADSRKNCIFKYTRDGRFIRRWGIEGKADGQFDCPFGIALDKAGFVHVVDLENYRIQKFSANGEFIAKWGSRGTGKGQFGHPEKIAMDRDGYIYVTEPDCVHKFSRDGRFILKWGKRGKDKGEFGQVINIATDAHGHVYVADREYLRINKFTSKGKFITRWGGRGTEEGKLSGLTAITVDRQGDILAVGDGFIHKFSPDGKFIGRWGKPGFEPGQLDFAEDMAIGKDGRLYLAGSVGSYSPSRIQVLRELSTPYGNKAVILAGGGPFRDRTIWEEQAEMNANFAYRTLLYQGFPKKSLFYLSADTRMDLDGNGKSDDISAYPKKEKVRHVLTGWAAGAEDVLIYLVGPGGADGLALTGKESLSAEDLQAWLDELQEKITGRIILIVDASRSGIFVDRLSAGASEKRIVISSTASDEKAWFVHQGTVSFSHYFWSRIFNGCDLGEAFSHARDAMELSSHGAQHARLEANGEAPANEAFDMAIAGTIHIGNGASQHEEIPKIAHVAIESLGSSAPPGDSIVRIAADGVTDTDYIARVWAMIIPPGITPGAETGSVCELPSVDLYPKSSGSYEGNWPGMRVAGVYKVAVYAMDRAGNTCAPICSTFTAGSP